ncbi:hypothetical protein BH23BAC3_BH23BAC3_25620 [soil metagenome]
MGPAEERGTISPRSGISTSLQQAAKPAPALRRALRVTKSAPGRDGYAKGSETTNSGIPRLRENRIRGVMNWMSKHIIAMSETPKGDGSLRRYGRQSDERRHSYPGRSHAYGVGSQPRP